MEGSGLRQVQSFSVLWGHGATFLGTQVAHTCSDITPTWPGSRGHGQPRLASVHREVLGGGSTVSGRFWCPSSGWSVFSSRVPSRGRGRPRLRWGPPPAGPAGGGAPRGRGRLCTELLEPSSSAGLTALLPFPRTAEPSEKGQPELPSHTALPLPSGSVWG